MQESRDVTGSTAANTLPEDPELNEEDEKYEDCRFLWRLERWQKLLANVNKVTDAGDAGNVDNINLILGVEYPVPENFEPVDPGKQKGRQCSAQNINVGMRYMVNEKGQMIDGRQAAEMRKTAQGIFQDWKAGGTLYKSWGKVPAKQKNQFFLMLRSKHPEFRLCANNWKADMMCTKYYPSFIQESGGRNRKKDGEDKVSVCFIDDCCAC